jgi:hypothetical protein
MVKHKLGITIITFSKNNNSNKCGPAFDLNHGQFPREIKSPTHLGEGNL